MSYSGKALIVDLTTRTHRFEEIEERVLRAYVGGYGLGAWYSFLHQRAGVDPLGPDNILCFCPGLLNGTGASFGGRFMVTARSPLTGGWGDANCGGKFGPSLHLAGVDLLAIHGAAARPAILVIDNDKVEVRDAEGLWGLDAVATEDALCEKLGSSFSVAAIGTAGEKLVRFAGIVNHRGRIAARSGLGAVMGSKKLKAVVARGKSKPRITEAELMKSLTRGYNKTIKGDTAADKVQDFLVQRAAKLSPLLRALPIQMRNEGVQFRHVLLRYGTSGITAMSAEVGDSPVRNWAGSGHHDFPLKSHALRIDGPKIVELQTKSYACSACPLGCGGITKCGDVETHKPEYETLCALGTNCLVADRDLLFELNEKMNRAGVDCITMGALAAFAFEAWEKGVITEADTGGVKLVWGDGAALRWLVERTIAREGLGDVLAEGLKLASERLKAPQLAMHAGGEALAMHDSRYDPTFALSYSSDPTPGRHTVVAQTYVELMGLAKKLEGISTAGPLFRKAEKYDPRGRGAAMAIATRYMQVANCMGLCSFALMTGDAPVLEFLNAATGWGLTMEQLLETGERVQTLRQSYNVREGLTPADFALPGRALGRPSLEKGPLKGVNVDVETMQREYFAHLGWDLATGRPAPERLERLGLGYVRQPGGAGTSA